MSERKTFTVTVQQVKSINEFRQPSGMRYFGKLYFQLCTSIMVPDCIHHNTDVDDLTRKIEKGIIYTLID